MVLPEYFSHRVKKTQNDMRVLIVRIKSVRSVRIQLHDKPLHLLVALSRMALVDTILPYLLTDRGKERS